MQHPFQCVATIAPVSERATSFLLAACGPNLLSMTLDTGETISQWSTADVAVTREDTSATNGDNNDRPKKKQKTISSASEVQPSSDIIKLAVAPDSQHIVAVTGGKRLHVLCITHDGGLLQLSSRCMPKRPCAIQILPDNATILCGDKFGDVYSLPLIPAIKSMEQQTTASREAQEDVEMKQKPFKPSATEKTVHSQRNLRALAAQQKQQNLTTKSREPLDFEQKLLLGHVSMLTDLSYISHNVDGKDRGYIITADRDEHIRISRGPPQSHIIEGYCLGHTEFVNRLCIMPDTNLLVSGGGDSWLGVWDWPSSQLKRKLPLNKVFGKEIVAVSGLWIGDTDAGRVLLVACEKSSKMGVMPVTELLGDELHEDPWSIADLGFAVLDVAFAHKQVLVSFDAREDETLRLRAYRVPEVPPQGLLSLVPDSVLSEKLQRASTVSLEPASAQHVDDLLYNVEKLRKKAGQEENQEET